MRRFDFFQLPHRLAMGWLFLALPAAVSVTAAPVRAASEVEVEGAHMRLDVVEGNGRVQAALSIDLKPGWKTYWISPGPVGLAPAIQLDNSAGVEDARILLPVPTRFREGDIESIGYAEPVSFVVLGEAKPGETSILRADITIGLCRELCLPVHVELEAKPSTSLNARAAVRRALAALPQDVQSDDIEASMRQGRLHVASASREGPPPTDAFVAAPEGWGFGVPVAGSDAHGFSLDIPILSTPGTDAELTKIDLVLTDGEKAELIRALPVGRN
ncbi:hypothetical protein NS226_03055 [Aureimonas ureilytica]|uniref:Thiol:disulfide interchange protein DsbD N-terminal domain-containing protein n=1 Tax=Aureimonas ureilytica TaxID=401562 RepID=A0A175RCJ2_9HYPH|nr:protein-disulfide reductase DsbD domain-containing protein [Aureimonas ureilytica]KTQ97655.1 hypothetical protein NS226_03055 [Aureimonas ureilytica]